MTCSRPAIKCGPGRSERHPAGPCDRRGGLERGDSRARTGEIRGAKPADAEDYFDRFRRPVADVPLDITPPEGTMPLDKAATEFAEGTADPRDYARTVQIVCSYTPWTICYRPLYFEEISLERYGWTHGLVQPAISGAHFFGSVALLPYKMTVRRPRSCLCSNGFSRCGDCPMPRLYSCVLAIGCGAGRGGRRRGHRVHPAVDLMPLPSARVS